MKNKCQSIGALILLLLITSFPLSAANAMDEYPKVETLRTEIIALVKRPTFNLLSKPKETVKLSFLVNSNKELVVIDADTESPYLKEFIKNNLNYQEIKTDFVRLNKIYHMKLTFKRTAS